MIVLRAAGSSTLPAFQYQSSGSFDTLSPSGIVLLLTIGAPDDVPTTWNVLLILSKVTVRCISVARRATSQSYDRGDGRDVRPCGGRMPEEGSNSTTSSSAPSSSKCSGAPASATRSAAHRRIHCGTGAHPARSNGDTSLVCIRGRHGSSHRAGSRVCDRRRQPAGVSRARYNL